ncbi:MAG: MFS transporter [Heliobacteriaceae bacterium]|nr:MFS transporter [Heliobacteriaceae bacterium]
MEYIEQGTREFRRANLALFFGAFVTYAILYCPQPLMPVLSHEFGVSPPVASLALSLTTAVLAVSMLVTGSVSEVWGRKPIMVVALFLSSVLVIGTACSPSFGVLLFWRVLQGLVLAGLPAIAMAYLSEEIHPHYLGLAIGMYISGNSIGGMAGRIIIGTVTDYFSWRLALVVVGVCGLAASFFFWRCLPPSRHFKPRRLRVQALVHSLWQHVRNRSLLRVYLTGFLLMGSFVTLFNYITYVLVAPPFNLSQTFVGWLFIIYLVGTFSSTWMGQLEARHHRRRVLWSGVAIMLAGALITLDGHLLIKLFGVAVFTFGFFGAHSIASSWVVLLATHDKAQASALYLFFYYLGSSIAGTLGGVFWTSFGWLGVVGMISLFLVGLFGITAGLADPGRQPAGPVASRLAHF